MYINNITINTSITMLCYTILHTHLEIQLQINSLIVINEVLYK